MKHPKLLGLMFMALTLFVNQSCKKDEACEEKTWYHDGDTDGEGDSGDTKKACDKPDGYVANANDPDDTNADIFSNCTMVTYYLDNDGDTFGDPNQSLELCDGVAAPDKYVTDNTDPNDSDANDFPGCETVTYYLDDDGDTYGDPDEPLALCDGVAVPEKYVTDNTDCDDSNANINPDAEEIVNDGVDNDCDGEQWEATIWTGEEKVYTKTAFADWTLPENQDQITTKVVFTRQNSGPMYNYQWWQDVFGEDATHNNASSSDLVADFWDNDDAAIKDIAAIDPSGGTKGVRWALLDDTGAENPNTAWENFSLYGQLGDPTHFYSFNNLAAIIESLETGQPVNNVLDDFTIDNDEDAFFNYITGKHLGVWLVEEDIYLTLTFTEWGNGNQNPGGPISYTRSTPDL
ncbi:MAG: putative metal-binding motif-containing protein [Flavobacteriaceae bacterium]|uniref:putative metal-binding motif-containing protein n=1 Tax=Flagellimonas sp. SN16 TaxID=3415142 RepID=UPI003C4B707B|nr:putative metal-binding motif-containing protein [Flavobacteriaceae bacterium]